MGSAKAQDRVSNPFVKQGLEKFEKSEEAEKEGGEIPAIRNMFGETIRLNGGIALNYEYRDVQDVGDQDNGGSSDFFIDTAELVLGVFFNEWSKAKFKVEAVDVGRKGEKETVRLDEAFLALKSLRMPLYLVGGKTVLPFAIIDNHLIEDPLTEELYEIDEWGATLGFYPDIFGLDVSFSLYRNPRIADNLKDFKTHEFTPGRQKEDAFQSFLVNVTLEPVEDTLSMSAFYDSEPGDGARNQSIGGSITLNYRKFILDAGYITALQREKGENGEENRESAGVVGLAFDLLDSLQLAARYEVFRDGTRGDQDEVLDYRIAAGFNYSILGLVNVSFLNDATLSFEYRYSKFEKEQNSNAANSQNTFQFQLALGF